MNELIEQFELAQADMNPDISNTIRDINRMLNESITDDC